MCVESGARTVGDRDESTRRCVYVFFTVLAPLIHSRHDSQQSQTYRQGTAEGHAPYSNDLASSVRSPARPRRTWSRSRRSGTTRCGAARALSPPQGCRRSAVREYVSERGRATRVAIRAAAVRRDAMAAAALGRRQPGRSVRAAAIHRGAHAALCPRSLPVRAENGAVKARAGGRLTLSVSQRGVDCCPLGALRERRRRRGGGRPGERVVSIELAIRAVEPTRKTSSAGTESRRSLRPLELGSTHLSFPRPAVEGFPSLHAGVFKKAIFGENHDERRQPSPSGRSGACRAA